MTLGDVGLAIGIGVVAGVSMALTLWVLLMLVRVGGA